jgi:3-methylfumaryl-CoA hydratase
MDIESLSPWIGRTETAQDRLMPQSLGGLAALLDHEAPPWPSGEIPPLGHWLAFLPNARQSELGSDGHPRLGGFLPPVPLPRRMWAGSRLDFLKPISVGEAIERRSVIVDIRHKQGGAGDLVFVTVRHEITTKGELAIVDEQDIVYRGDPAKTPAQQPVAPLPADIVRQHSPDPTQLFRFSALTFNGHRIHYDRDYARDIEGYGGLVVHGPFQALLLMDHFLKAERVRRVKRFAFVARRPLFDTAPFDLCLAWTSGGARLWTLGRDGLPALTAELTAD